jgi:hypothetical protein
MVELTNGGSKFRLKFVSRNGFRLLVLVSALSVIICEKVKFITSTSELSNLANFYLNLALTINYLTLKSTISYKLIRKH